MADDAERKAKEAEVEAAIRLTNDLLAGRIRPENVPEAPVRGRRPMSWNYSREREAPPPAPPPPADCWPSEAEILRKARERAAEQLGKR